MQTQLTYDPDTGEFNGTGEEGENVFIHLVGFPASSSPAFEKADIDQLALVKWDSGTGEDELLVTLQNVHVREHLKYAKCHNLRLSRFSPFENVRILSIILCTLSSWPQRATYVNLRDVRLHLTPLGDEGATWIADVMRDAPFLHHVGLGGNGVNLTRYQLQVIQAGKEAAHLKRRFGPTVHISKPTRDAPFIDEFIDSETGELRRPDLHLPQTHGLLTSSRLAHPESGLSKFPDDLLKFVAAWLAGVRLVSGPKPTQPENGR